MQTYELLRAKGIKATPQRRAVYAVLAGLGHASVEEVAHAVSEKYPATTVSTIYNVLNCLADNDVISRMSTTRGKLYYDITPEEHCHIVVDDQPIADYHNEELTELLAKYIEQHPIEGLEIERIDLQLHAKKIKTS